MGEAQIVLERYGRCDVLVHAAAMVGIEPFDELDLVVSKARRRGQI
jgi:hypothetical protein